jgi:hypothetical protein
LFGGASLDAFEMGVRLRDAYAIYAELLASSVSRTFVRRPRRSIGICIG